MSTPVGAVRADLPLGHELLGTGPVRVVILNDWMCDTSTWDGARPYLDGARFTFALADLRGYGLSRGREGAFTVEECAADVLALAGGLGLVTTASAILARYHAPLADERPAAAPRRRLRATDAAWVATACVLVGAGATYELWHP